MADLTIRRNKDMTITIRFGRYRESVSIDGKSPTELLDAVRYAAITAGVHVSEETIWAQLRPQLYD